MVKNDNLEGKLYVVGTPIGNLGDISARALDTLEKVDFIAAEDTRVSVKLLTHFGIKKSMISCHEHNIVERSHEIINRLQNGESCAIITDAGMPCISDPGEELIRLCRERGVPIEVVPGPSALIAALAVSGLTTSRFSFEGFLSVTKKQRYMHLEEIKKYKHTLIFYEAPHKLINTLEDLLTVLGDRNISACRELTKLHEEVRKGKMSELIEHYKETAPRGEFVLIIEGYTEEEKNEITFEDAVEMTKKLISDGYKLSEACKITAEQTKFKKSEIYKELANNEG